MLSLIRLQRIDDARGSLVATQGIPFAVRRAYWIFGVHPDATRGGHAHRTLDRWIVAVAGAFSVRLESSPLRSLTLRMENPAEALHVPPMHWLTLSAFSAGGVCLALASAEYEAYDYIRDRARWDALTRGAV